MTSLVCLGDSFTEGMVDELRSDGRHAGWADRVATGLALAWPDELRYANLAIRGKLLDQVVAEQIPVAIALRPDVMTFHAGSNDVLRPRTDLSTLHKRYESAVLALCGTGARVLLFTGRSRGTPHGRLTSRIGPKLLDFNRNVREVAARHGCEVVDLAGLSVLSDPRCWGPDRIHLNDLGHSRVAAVVLSQLGVTDPEILGGTHRWWAQPLPPSTEGSQVARVRSDLEWTAKYLMPWVGRRIRGVSSGDGMEPKDAVLRLVARSMEGSSVPGAAGVAPPTRSADIGEQPA